MSASKVRKAFVIHVENIAAGLPGNPPVSWPNKTFKPPGGLPWLQFNWIPAGRRAVTLGDQGEDELVGIVQIDINTPQGDGDAVMENLLSLLEEEFIAGQVVIHDGQPATIESCSRLPSRNVDPFYRSSLSVNYYARVTRSLI